jgi:hypothetical protein
MKKTFILLSLLVLVFSANTFAQKQMTARQLFMSLPSEYVIGTAKQRAAFLSFPDTIKPDTLSFFIYEGGISKKLGGNFQEPQAIGSMRVFRGKSSTIIGLRYQVDDRREKNPTVDTTKIITVLLENKNGKWTNVTESKMPKVSADYAYKILIETQLGIDKNGLAAVARIKGDTSVTSLKWFKWTGKDFVESADQ